MPSMNEPPRSGQRYWRSLEHLSETTEFQEFLHREFPKGASELLGEDRRQFLKLMGASMALAGLGLAGCRRWPEQEIAAYAQRPEGRDPGVAQHFASTWELGGVGHGLLVTAFDGRPTKIEGNPDHPTSQGAADLFAQASILDLYDPDRSRAVRHQRGDDAGRQRLGRIRRLGRPALLRAARAEWTRPRRALRGDLVAVRACDAAATEGHVSAVDVARVRGVEQRRRPGRGDHGVRTSGANAPRLRTGPGHGDARCRHARHGCQRRPEHPRLRPHASCHQEAAGDESPVRVRRRTHAHRRRCGHPHCRPYVRRPGHRRHSCGAPHGAGGR